MTIDQIAPQLGEDYPVGTLRIDYKSSFDGASDWALFLPGDQSRKTVVYHHGAFSFADQIFTRRDVREWWLTRIRAAGHPLLSVNLRDTSYMSPAATHDFTELLDFCRAELRCGEYTLLGGSGGASSTMAYAVLHPERVAGVVAMGMCDLFARLKFATESDHPVLQRLALVVHEAYDGTPEELPEVYRERSVLAHPERLTMPIVLTMGEADALLPVAETRKVAEALAHHPNFVYVEIPDGNHDAALWVDVDLETVRLR